MACEDLFEQGRTGTGQTHDKDGIGGSAALSRSGRKELAREQGFRAPDKIGDAVRTVSDRFPPDSVAITIRLKGGCVIPRVFQRFPQRELHLRAAPRIEVWTRKCRSHRGDIIRTETEGLEIREAPVAFAVV